MKESEWEEIRIGNLSTKFKEKLYLRNQLEKIEEGFSAVKHWITSIAVSVAQKLLPAP